MRAVKEMIGILDDELRIQEALKGEARALKALREHVDLNFDELERALEEHRLILQRNYTPSQVATLTAKLSQLRKTFYKLQQAAQKLNRKNPSSLWKNLETYLAEVVRGIDQIKETLTAQVFTNADQILMQLGNIFRKDKASLDQEIDSRLRFVGFQSQKRAA